MPTIIVDPKKGLHQKAATSTEPAGSLSGHKNVVKTLTGATTLTETDSGKTFLLSLSEGTVQFPVKPGWHGEFIITGSCAAVVSGSDAGGIAVDGISRQLGGDASEDAVVIANGKATFQVGTTASGDRVKINVLTTALIDVQTATST